MLYFSKLRIAFILLVSIILTFFTLSNFTNFENNIIDKKINLGLDLQGGSYLLLEIDNTPVIIKELQNKSLQIKNLLKEKNLNIKNIKVTDDNFITFISESETINEKIKHKKLMITKTNCKNVNDNILVSNMFELLKFLYEK